MRVSSRALAPATNPASRDAPREAPFDGVPVAAHPRGLGLVGHLDEDVARADEQHDGAQLGFELRDFRTEFLRARLVGVY